MTRHAYPASAMLADYARAAAGLVPSGLLLATTRVGIVSGVVLGGVAAMFGAFGLRTLLRHGTAVEVSDTEIRASGRARGSIAWTALDRMKLAFYSTRRDGSDGWMQLELAAGGTKLHLDSRIAGFPDLVRRAAAASVARHLELSPSTLANLQALDIVLPSSPETPPEETEE